MEFWLATTLSAILLSVCTVDVTPGADMEQVEDTTPDMVANVEDETPDVNLEYLQDYFPDVKTEQYDTDVNIEQYDTRVMNFPQVQAISPRTCLQSLYILAFTSGRRYAGSDSGHEVEVRAAGQTKVIKLPNRPGDDYRKNKGDLWKLTFHGDLKFTRCVTLKNIDHVAIESGGNDGWNIDSIVNYVGVTRRGSKELTRNFNAFCWIDGNGATSHRRFMLRNVH